MNFQIKKQKYVNGASGTCASSKASGLAQEKMQLSSLVVFNLAMSGISSTVDRWMAILNSAETYSKTCQWNVSGFGAA